LIVSIGNSSTSLLETEQPAEESDSDVVELSDGENEDEEEEVGSEEDDYHDDQGLQIRAGRQEVYDLSDDEEEGEIACATRARPLVRKGSCICNALLGIFCIFLFA
jgi:hypothetical protein